MFSWMSVSEKLPAPGQDVVLWSSVHGEWVKGCFAAADEDGPDGWHYGIDNANDFIEREFSPLADGDITHWMAVPDLDAGCTCHLSEPGMWHDHGCPMRR